MQVILKTEDFGLGLGNKDLFFILSILKVMVNYNKKDTVVRAGAIL